jgi:hypothetical protein
MEALNQLNQKLKAKLEIKIDTKTVQTREQSTGTDLDTISLNYVIKLEKKYSDFKIREQRFLKVLKILQGKGVNLKQIKDELSQLD